MPHEISLGVCLFGKSDGGVATVKLRIESCARQPLPIAAVAGDFVVDEPFLEDFGATLPVNVAAASRQEAGNGVAAKVVDPSFLSELTH